MGLPEEVGRTARTAVQSWPGTVRLCMLILASGAAAALFLTIFLMVMPAVSSRP
jgi:hypothetical protein